ncbi:MAG: 4-hydroxybenzoate octaprenyltransferase [Ferrovum sp. 37-45-19]|jgi:4-hydroxybenzoate polyprenyltransferase|uniref:4-hydroxybenzoate octaprenyltransferase n=1 Tax=Ferrovum sp. JA12 TaxID=1356299 RepID=UPI0007030B20|nr:4-hydroxybenzoate octaprenyltransferase [Ferrovum sp. JA12]OYV79589.1 MAG: 4-hydroxybenzoate octaprenyltransferase [Ferrovum sp. 21-44-67]OYV94616.1 MAG: 4-hydroxybenzoate octaprenyltransferase [Ferrovum sp. 37-45-19]OZB34558.1 MAG: 4-hydroxybenzoate octaprenyltransferase [Ferrovum sp. 34-44-207]HQT81511.1 4-hydroxybenzoate octaprenyltransferase [Ferrovaceae bacterium]KRH79483.1 4-hydroxybenzoate octaprenyltransferase [Ferrovum sp. JA12]
MKLSLFLKLMRLDKPIGILLLLWPTMWALWIASNGHPGFHLLSVFILGTVLMRSAGCVVNDIADRKFDRYVARTKDRPITSGQVTVKEALILTLLLFLLSFLLILSCNTLTIFLSLVAVFLAVSYPFTKRFLSIPQAYLGIAFGFGIPMAFAAQLNFVPSVAGLLLLANLFWAIAYDTEYAMVDREDDIKIGIHSSALLFGKHDVLAIMSCYALTLFLLFIVGVLLHFGFVYFIFLLIATLIALYHFSLIRKRDSKQCFKAFLHNNWFGGVVFLGIVVGTTLR